MTVNQTQEPPAYRERLRSYSDEELEDIYYNIDILKNSTRYRILIREMERRQLLPAEPKPDRKLGSLRDWLDSKPVLARHPAAGSAALATGLFLATALATFALYSPIWLFAIPLKLLQIETALVYF